MRMKRRLEPNSDLMMKARQRLLEDPKNRRQRISKKTLR